MKSGLCDNTGKVRYSGRNDARRALSELRRYRGNRFHTHEADVYRCIHCGDWHMTSHPRKVLA
jgi:hypothetical protein